MYTTNQNLARLSLESVRVENARVTACPRPLATTGVAVGSLQPDRIWGLFGPPLLG